MSVLAPLAIGATAALAYFVVSGLGEGTVKVGQLAAPTGVGTSVSNATVTISWSEVTPPTGAHVTGYYVQRFKGATPSAACGSSSSSLLAGTAVSCNDTVPENGTFTYKVIAVWRTWSTASAASSNVSVTAYPTVASISPGGLAQGASSQNLTVTGTGFVSGSGLAASFSSSGITVNSTTYNSSTSLTVNVTLSSGATTGASNVTVTNPSTLTGTCTECFYVYGISNIAHGEATSGTTMTSSSFTLSASGNGYLVFASSNSSSGDSASVSTSSFTTSPTATAVGSMESYDGSADHNWVWYLKGGSGTGTITVTFGKSTSDAYLDVIKVAGANNGSPVVTSTEGRAVSGGSEASTSTSSTATAKLTGSPASTDAELVFLSGSGDMSPSGPGDSSSSIVAISGSYLHNPQGSNDAFGGTGASSSEISFTLGSNLNWGTIALEITGDSVGVSSTSPTYAARGETKNVTISGYGFESGANATFSNSEITVNSTTYNSATSVTANITVAAGATLGASNVTVTNSNGKKGTCSECFTVSTTPTVSAVSPGSLVRGASSQSLTVTGTGFVNAAGLAASFSSTGITVNSTTYNSSTSLTVNVSVSESATLGASNVTVTNPGSLTGSCSECFYVYSISQAAHGEATSGTTVTSSSFTLSASGNGYLVFASSMSSSGDSASVSTSSFTTSPTATAVGSMQSYDGNADHNWVWYLSGGSGTGTVTVTFGKSTSKAYLNVIKVGGANNTVPVISATEGRAESGGSEASTSTSSTATAKLTGSPESTNAELVFLSGNGDMSPSGPTDSSSNIVAISGAYMHGMGGSQDAFGGAKASTSEISLTTGSMNWGTIALEVTGGPVAVASTSPTYGLRSETKNVTITGAGFESGANATFSNSEITVNSTTYNSATSVTANITIGSSANGSSNVTVTNSNGRHGSCAECFKVVTTPTVSSISPSHGLTGGGTVLTLTGTEFSHASEVKFGTSAGTSLTVLSETELRITSPSHSAGEVNVTVVNPAGTSSSTATYTFNAFEPSGIQFIETADGAGTYNCTASVLTSVACVASGTGGSNLTGYIEFFSGSGSYSYPMTGDKNTSGSTITITNSSVTGGGTPNPAEFSISNETTASNSKTLVHSGPGNVWTFSVTYGGTTYHLTVEVS